MGLSLFGSTFLRLEVVVSPPNDPLGSSNRPYLFDYISPIGLTECIVEVI
jgi:hypothetical protein